MSIARKIGNLGTALDSAALSTFLSKGTTDGEFDTIAWGDVTGKPSYIDSSLATQLFDSAYVQARQTAVSSGGLDSAAVTTLIDSSYVANRAGTGSSGFIMYNYNATSGQTAFQDSDTAGNVLSYTADGILVYYNGLLLADEDYTATDGAAVTLTEGADSGAQITIGKWNLTGSGSSSGSSGPAFYGDTALVAGGNDGSTLGTNNIQYYSISTTGNASDFGDLTTARQDLAAMGDGTYAVFATGFAVSARSNVMDYVTVATTSNASDFGDAINAHTEVAGSANDTYGLLSGGQSTTTNQIQYITVASPSNASDFGDLTVASYAHSQTNDDTYAVFAGGFSGAGNNTISYVTIATPSNATDFGDLLGNPYPGLAATGDSTRGLFAGGKSSPNDDVIQYITFSTPSNAVDFGDLYEPANSRMGGSSDGTYATWAGGYSEAAGSAPTVTIQRNTIQTLGNAVDHGDLVVARYKVGACSGT